MTIGPIVTVTVVNRSVGNRTLGDRGLGVGAFRVVVRVWL
jgi:hypothetical protein